MSTKQLRELLARIKEYPNGIGDALLHLHDGAASELEAISRAAVAINRENTARKITDAESREAQAAHGLMERIAKETGT